MKMTTALPTVAVTVTENLLQLASHARDIENSNKLWQDFQNSFSIHRDPRLATKAKRQCSAPVMLALVITI
jgi:hypothetical protein